MGNSFKSNKNDFCIFCDIMLFNKNFEKNITSIM